VADDMHAAVRELRARVQTDVTQRLATKEPLWPAGAGCDVLQGNVPDDVILVQVEVDLGRPAEFVTATISLRRRDRDLIDEAATASGQSRAEFMAAAALAAIPKVKQPRKTAARKGSRRLCRRN
jgi:hypothetical protein